jgi:hypothetical protein
MNLATEGQLVAIKAWNQVIRHVELHPGDGAGIRDAYADRRYKIASFLKEKGVIKSFEVQEGSHRWENLIVIEADRDDVNRTLKLCAGEEHRRRSEAQPQPGVGKGAEPTTHAKAPWTRTDKLTLAGVILTALALIAAYLSIPGFQDWVRSLIHAARQ